MHFIVNLKSWTMSNWQTIRLVALTLLVGGVFILAYFFYQHEMYFCVFFSLVWVLLILLYQTHIYARSFNRMARMVEAIRYGDLTLNFSTQEKSDWENRMAEQMNEVMSRFRSALSEKEEKYQYFETLLDSVDTSVLVVDNEGKVLWMNRTGVQDLCGHAIHHLEELKSLNHEFPMLLETLMPGEVKVIRIYKAEAMLDLAVTVTDYSTNRVHRRLINLKNIRSILEENEMEAWRKLVRVLTHEIMNSITPIISLSDTLCDRALQRGLDEEDVTFRSMKAIHRRSKGLLNFVENYRKLSRLPSPALAPVSVADLLDNIKKLFLSSRVHHLYKVEDENQMLMIDRSLMEQVLINLLKNADEACADEPNPEVVVETAYDEEKHIFKLSVTDNGCGILPGVVDRIFIPFFTTKPTGSGIGLSLCKQIMTLHGGSIQVASEEGKGSCFTLKLWVK